MIVSDPEKEACDVLLPVPFREWASHIEGRREGGGLIEGSVFPRAPRHASSCHSLVPRHSEHLTDEIFGLFRKRTAEDGWSCQTLL